MAIPQKEEKEKAKKSVIMDQETWSLLEDYMKYSNVKDLDYAIDYVVKEGISKDREFKKYLKSKSDFVGDFQNNV